jgi:pimeloyl-ACP methyl ester carboxylesterase
MQFVLIPGAGGVAWYWHRVVPLLEAAGAEAVAVDLPGDDPHAGLDAYTERVITAIGGRTDSIVVGQSLGGFTAAMVCARVPVAMLVFVNAMIPLPGETPGAWWEATGQQAARIAAAERGGYATEFDVQTYFLHDVPPDVVTASASHKRDEADVVFDSKCKFERWPDIEIRAIAGADDRFFPVEFQRRVARERVQREVEVVPGGHLVTLSHPRELAEHLLSYLPAASRKAH